MGKLRVDRMIIPLIVVIGAAVLFTVIMAAYIISNVQHNFGRGIAIISLVAIVGLTMLPLIGRFVG